MNGAAKRTVAQRLVPLLVILMIVLPSAVRSRGFFAEIWPRWAVLIEQLLLVIAGALVIAVIAFGIQAWRQAKRPQNDA
jgi:hypothetical protein